jgi:uncharacterized protein YndB with AHSA1/START domain
MHEHDDPDTPLVTEQLLHCPPGRVWDALTDENKMRVWYFPQLVAFRPEPGFSFVFADDGAAYHKIWQVLEVRPGEKLVHSWRYTGYPGSSTVRFELVPAGPGTIVRVIHTGIASFPRHPHFARARFEAGWRTILGVNLKSLLERQG